MSRRLGLGIAVAALIAGGCAAAPAGSTVRPEATGAVTSSAAAGSGAPSASGAPSGSTEPSPSAETISEPADDGARIVEVKDLPGRMRDLTIESPAVGKVMVRLLLPSTYDRQPAATFPVLYLLHGASGEYTDWTLNTDVEAMTRPTDLLVVMPAGASSDSDGWYTDWVARGKQTELDHPPMWETFHLTELGQLLERNYRASDNRAVAGNSMGGYGAIVYAERDARLFKAAASYSGALDVIPATKRQPNADDIARWGDPTSDASNWDAHDPLKMLPQLRGTALYISYGDGQPGPLDPAGADKDLIETQVDQGNLRFTDALTQAGIAATVDAYGPGTHSWPYWNRELRASLPIMLAALGQPSGVLLPSTAASVPAASSAAAASASAPASPAASY